MLPFHMRPPAYGAKLKKKRQHTSSVDLDSIHPYRDGGPLQRAIQDDLLDVRPLFCDAVASLSEGCNVHHPNGAAFAIYKAVFGSAKLALLHTRVVPCRVDREAYTQLLYAASFNLLHKSFCEKTFEFTHAAFALFSLFVLYHTCPLDTVPPIAGSNKDERLEMFPLGIRDPQNPRRLYQRAFHQRIRIDQLHYEYLDRLRDIALAQIGKCEERKWQADLDRVTAAVNIALPSCECSLATDVVAVLDRLRENFEFCSYTGPMGLEALAGHSAYPFPESKVAWSTLGRYSSFDTTHNTSEFSSGNPCESKEWHADLQNSLDNYLVCLQSIRLPPVNQGTNIKFKRIREGLLGIFKKTRSTDFLSKLSDILHGRQNALSIYVKPQTVSFGSIIHIENAVQQNAERKQSPGNETERISEQVLLADREHSGTDLGPSFELLLPSNISPEMQRSLQDAFETLLDRKEGYAQQQAMTLASLDEVSTAGELSTLGRSMESSTTLGVGQGALQALLSKASEAVEDVRHQSIPFGGFFLSTEEDDDISTQPRNAMNKYGEAESIDDDAVSVATESVGRAALDRLLSAVCPLPPTPAHSRQSVTPSRKVNAKRKRSLSSSLAASTPRKRPALNPSGLPTKDESSTNESLGEGNTGYSTEDSDGDDSLLSAFSSESGTTGQGSSALNVLLSTVLLK